MHETIEISGKYRNLVTQMSRLILEQIKVSKHKRLSYEVIMFKEIVNRDIPLHFYLGLQTMYTNNLYVTGDAYNPTEPVSDQIPYIEISIGTNGEKKHLSRIALRLSNTLRHEIEHITQSEIPAMLHGLHTQAKKERKSFLDKMHEYLDETYLLESDMESIRSIWISKAKELNLVK